MSLAKPDPLPEAQAGARVPACRHFRFKAMLVYTDDASRDALHEHDSNHCWCVHTMKAFGPDDSLVAGADCRDPARGCYDPA